MNPKGVLFSVAASHQIGTGHLLRCLNIARHLVGETRIFFCIEGDQGAASFIKEKWVEILAPERALEFRPSLVVVDRLEAETSSLIPFKEKGVKILLLDSLSNWEMADTVINALPHPPYHHRPPRGLKVFEGPSYICLGEDIIRARQGLRPIKETVSKILVTCGGSDPYGLTIKLAKALVQLPNSPSITFVLGRIFKDRKELEGVVTCLPARQVGKDYTIVQDAQSLAPYMMKADMALTSFGLTVYETACLGLPVIMLPPTRDHNLRAEIFAKHGAAINLGLNEEVSLDKIVGEVEGLRSNFDLCRKMSQAGKNLVDGQGAARVARIILDLLS